MWFKLHRNVSNSQVYSNDEFDLWPVYSGERFRAFRPSCFLLKKCEKLLQASLIFFSTKNINVFGYKVVKHWTSWPLYELVKLTMLWTTGTWFVIICQPATKHQEGALLTARWLGLGNGFCCNIYLLSRLANHLTGTQQDICDKICHLSRLANVVLRF